MAKKLQKRVKRLNKDQIAAMFAIFADTIKPESELNWETPLDLAIAVLLSAQATDVSVNKATVAMFAKCRCPEDYIQLGEEGVREHIKTIGLYRNKAKAVIGLCERVRDVFGGEIPDNREDLQSLPGVGRKTANVILNVVFDQPTLAVDTHIFRVGNRMGMCAAKTPEATEQALLKVIPQEHLHPAHHYLILHGRYTCKARKPECGSCRVRKYCIYPYKTEG